MKLALWGHGNPPGLSIELYLLCSLGAGSMPLLTIGISANLIASSTGSTCIDDSHRDDGPTVWLGVFASTLDAESSSGLMNRIAELSYD